MPAKTAYAKGTEVSVEKSQSGIRALLRKYGAGGFVLGEKSGFAQIGFEMRDRQIIMRLVLPSPDERRYTHAAVNQHSGETRRSAEAANRAWEQGCREKWRSLTLCIKAKLESVESSIETFDQAFFAHLVLPTGQTVSEWAEEAPNQRALFGGHAPPMLPGPRS